MRHLRSTLLVFLAAFLCTTGANAQVLGEATRSAALRRNESIEFEIKLGTKADWAGSYYFGNGTGHNYTLSLAPYSGFVLRLSGCMGLYGLRYGRVEERGDRLILVSESAMQVTDILPRATEFYPVRWDKRRYLIDASCMQRFIHDIESKSEPRQGHFGQHFLRSGSEYLPAGGRPDLPAAWRGWLLDEPLEGKVVAVTKREDKTPGDAYRGAIELTLDIGSKDGVLSKMRFFITKWRTWLIGRVIAVEPNRCILEVTMCRRKDKLPAKGWVWSTRDS